MVLICITISFARMKMMARFIRPQVGQRLAGRLFCRKCIRG